MVLIILPFFSSLSVPACAGKFAFQSVRRRLSTCAELHIGTRALDGGNSKCLKATTDDSRMQGYTIRQVSRFDAGRYACTADNGVGMPAKAFVSLQVLCKYNSI